MSPLRTALTPEPFDGRSFDGRSSEEHLLDGQLFLTEQLRRRLLTLDFPAFARCVCRLLDALGYEDARLAGRREWKGYNRHGGGGYDLEAALPGGVAARRVIAQIKQFDGLTVHQRSVDELRGACLRAGAAEALLVTTSAFSKVVRRHAAARDVAGAWAAPVRLIDGAELVSLLIRHRLGVKECSVKEPRVTECGLGRLRFMGAKGIGTRKPVGKPVKRLVIDEAFFRGITAPSHGTTVHGTAVYGNHVHGTTAANAEKLQEKSPAPDTLSLLRGWRVTVRVTSAPKPGRPRGTRPEGGGTEGSD